MIDLDDFAAKLDALVNRAEDFARTYAVTFRDSYRASRPIAILTSTMEGSEAKDEPIWISVRRRADSNHAEVARDSVEKSIQADLDDLAKSLRAIPIFNHPRCYVEIGVFLKDSGKLNIQLIIDGHDISAKPCKMPHVLKRVTAIVDALSSVPVSSPILNYIIHGQAVFAPDAGSAVLKYAVFEDADLLQRLSLPEPQDIPGVNLFLPPQDVLASIKAVMATHPTLATKAA